MDRKPTSIKIDPELWKKLKIKCIADDTDISTFLENLIRERLG